MEGVERYKLKLLPHNEAWRNEFLQVKDEIEALFKVFIPCWINIY